MNETNDITASREYKRSLLSEVYEDVASVLIHARAAHQHIELRDEMPKTGVIQSGTCSSRKAATVESGKIREFPRLEALG